MIDKARLLEIARLSGLRPWQQEKHYIQSLILTSLSEEPIVFKGGTYLWFFQGLERFSEDLDFTAAEALLRHDLPRRVSRDLELFGVENGIKLISDTESTISFRVDAKGPLNTSAVDLCRTYIEISKREILAKKPLSLKFDRPEYSLPVKSLRGMDLDEVGAEKVRAILTRHKARDIYDLNYLAVNKGVKFEEELVNDKLKYYNMQFDGHKFMEKVASMEGFYSKELKGIVFGRLTGYDGIKGNLKKWVASSTP